MSDLRSWLGPVADQLIPAGDGMPAATAVGVTGRQLDIVLAARPDLEDHLLRAWALARDVPPAQVLERLAELDPTAADALTETVAGGYYANPEVRALLGYTGQEPIPVRADGYADDAVEDLLARVVERGPLYRDPDR